jgi:hypothetical protein
MQWQVEHMLHVADPLVTDGEPSTQSLICPPSVSLPTDCCPPAKVRLKSYGYDATDFPRSAYRCLILIFLVPFRPVSCPFPPL